MNGVFRMALSEFRQKYFYGDKRPCANTLKKWIDGGDLPGEAIGGHYFVLVDARGEPIKSEVPKTGNEAADRILERWMQSKASEDKAA